MPICDCPKLDPSTWHDKFHDFSKLLFWSVPVRFFFHVIPNLAPYKARVQRDITTRGYVHDPNRHPMLLKDAAFLSKLYVQVEKANPANPGIERINATRVHSSLYTGPTAHLYAYANQLKTAIITQYGERPKRFYYWSLTCPICTPDPNAQRTIVFAEL